MVSIIEGELSGDGLRIAIIASRFNDEIVSLLLEGALDCLMRHGVAGDAIDVVRVPGAFEIPAAAARLAATHRYDAIITLGAVIRGETPHFDHIASQVTHAISRVAIDEEIAISFGVLTCDTFEQARARVVKGSNKGWEAALAGIETAILYRKIGKARS